MLDVIAFIVVTSAFVAFTAMTYRIFTTVKRESRILAEFRQSTALGYGALLFPLGPVIMLLIGIRAPLAGVLLCAACYVPGLVLARRVAAGLDGAGTDRVKMANDAVSQAFAVAIAGLVLAMMALVLLVATGSLRGPTDA